MKLDFLKYWRINFTLSAILLVASIFALVQFGLRPSIDFTGGALLEIQIDSQEVIPAESIQEEINDIITASSIQPAGQGYIIRSTTFDNETNLEIQDRISQEFGTVTEVRFETVGPTLGRELLIKTLYAVMLGSLAITLFVAYQFQDLKFGICAILAMIHDTLIVMGVFAWLGYLFGVEVDTLFVTALLITLAFSIHDTIVVYDRIRESMERLGLSDFSLVINKSIAETLVRSMNNSLTTIFMLSALFLLGGESIRWFVFALLIGTIIGTYSSPFVAAPLLALWDRVRNRES